MSEGRKSNLIPSVKSGKGIKILAELEARVNLMLKPKRITRYQERLLSRMI